MYFCPCLIFLCRNSKIDIPGQAAKCLIRLFFNRTPMVLKQKKNQGGYGMSTISLSGVTVSAPGGGDDWPSFDFPSSDGASSYGGGGGGGGTTGGGDSSNQDPGDNINDPNGT